MKEFKAKYSHMKARGILKEIRAEFKEKTEQEDFYLKSTDKVILRLKKEGDKIYLINFTKEKEGFGINLSECLDKEATDSLLLFFKDNPLVIKKVREHYFWRGAKIVLDNVVGLGELIELYPQDEVSKEELLEIFGINPSELITKSYYDMWNK